MRQAERRLNCERPPRILAEAKENTEVYDANSQVPADMPRAEVDDLLEFLRSL